MRGAKQSRAGHLKKVRAAVGAQVYLRGRAFQSSFVGCPAVMPCADSLQCEVLVRRGPGRDRFYQRPGPLKFRIPRVFGVSEFGFGFTVRSASDS